MFFKVCEYYWRQMFKFSRSLLNVLVLFSNCQSSLSTPTFLCEQESGNTGSRSELQGIKGTFSGGPLASCGDKSPALPQAAAWSSSHLAGEFTVVYLTFFFLSTVKCLRDNNVQLNHTERHIDGENAKKVSSARCSLFVWKRLCYKTSD